MKVKSALLAFVLASLCCSAVAAGKHRPRAAAAAVATFDADIRAIGGPIVSDGAALVAPLTTVTALCNNSTGGQCLTATGTVTLETGSIASGDYQNGATFASGGSVTISATDSTDSVDFTGVVTSATWTAARLANGTYTYTLTGNIQDSTTGQTGAFALVTTVIGAANVKFPGNAVVNYISIHLNP